MALGERDLLRIAMEKQGCTYEQIAAAMARQFGDRPRSAWRHAHGWTQNAVAERFNEAVRDERASMTGNRISDYERWPRKGGMKPTVRTLAVLAEIYSTRALDLIDSHDRQKLDAGELLALSTVEFVAVPRQLPSAIPNFVGRAHELQSVTAQLDGTKARGGAVLITSIGGTAGVGKTTLAVYWARAHIDQFPDGQLYVDLHGFDPSGTPITPETAIRSFLDAFQVLPEKIPLNPENQVALYRTLVEGKRLVIVLDNARDSNQVWPLLPGSPTCMVLVTSRQQLGSLIALKKALHVTLKLMTTDEARQLLTGFLGLERIHAELDAVDELIRLCAGLPMALSIAAARILLDPHLPLTTLVDQLREQHRRLDELSIEGDSQLTDIRAVISWSYTALTSQAARLFRLLGLHPGPDIGTLAAASLVGLSEQDTHNLLTELTRAHLLEQHISGRHQFHGLLRTYAIEQAAAEEPEQQRQAAVHRVLDHYLDTGFTADQHIYPTRTPITLQALQQGVISCDIPAYQQAMNWFTTEHAVLLAAIDHAAAHGFDTHAWQLPWTLTTFLNRQGHWHDLVSTQQTALAAAERLGDLAAQALALRLLGNAQANLGHYTEALVSLQGGLTLCRDLSDPNGQARAHFSLGWVCGRQGQYTEALTHAQHALDFYRATDNSVGQADALNTLGCCQVRLGHCQQALIYCQQALNLYRALGDRRGEANTLDSLGYAHHRLGHHDQAITHYQQSIALFGDIGDHYGKAGTLVCLGDTHQATGNIVAARDAWQQALTILDQLAHPDAEQVRAKLATLDGTGPDGPIIEGQL